MAQREQRRVISVVTDAFAPFHREVLDGLRPHFSAAGYGTLAVAGRDVRTDRMIGTTTTDLGEYNRAFGTHLDVCGSIVVCGATPPDMSDAAVAEYVGSLANGPVVSLGIRLPGVPSVTIAWDDAIRDLMGHMVDDPGRRRFAFVRGFAGDPHSMQREAGFRAGMAAAGLPVDETLVVSGNYSVADALNAVTGLLRGGRRFDGLIAANDDMATGAIAALTEHGLAVPDDVIVAGFDDSFAAFTCEPPLTTVRLDTNKLTEASATLLLGAIESAEPLPTDLEIQIESGLVKRESSRLPTVETASGTTGAAGEESAADLLARIITRWEPDRAPDRVDVRGDAEAAVQTLLTGDSAFEESRRRSRNSRGRFAGRAEVFWLRRAARELQALTVELGAEQIPEFGLRAMVSQLDAIDKRLLPIERLNEIDGTAHRQLQERLVMRLASCSDLESLWKVLRSGLGALGMKNAWVATNEPDDVGDDEAGATPTMRLLFSLEDNEGGSAERFPRASVLPERFSELLEQQVHVLVPLRAGVSDIGYMVVEPRGERLLELEAIALGIAQVLRHVHQIGDLEHQAAKLRLANQALDRMARHDSLTGLANRKAFLEQLERDIDSVTPDEQVSILFVDLDGFKLINDTLGHEAGDHLLRVVANRLGDVLGEGETLARLGGDEFTIITRHPRSVDRADEIARAALETAAQPCTLQRQSIQISASIGVAAYPLDATSTDELVRNADAAMYMAKDAGKNSYAHYSQRLAALNRSEADLREAIRRGLAQDEFELEYQPRVCLKSGRITAYEALLRWHPGDDVSMVDRQPDRFVLVAERSGLISALDAFSLDRACRDARRWDDAGRPFPVSVNVSVKRLQEADIVAQVSNALDRHRLAPELLELELSEHALTTDVAVSVERLTSVRALGVRCAIDDYGTGNSSLADLMALPLDTLKIDGSLVAELDRGGDGHEGGVDGGGREESGDVPERRDGAAATGTDRVRAIVALSNALGLVTVAEAVETEAQRQALIKVGCAQGQGYVLDPELQASVTGVAVEQITGELQDSIDPMI